MDHIPLPESCKPYAKKVPYLGFALQYDRLGFERFPERCGIDIERLASLVTDSVVTFDINVCPHTCTPSEYGESFLQEWLWFGMLHEFELTCGIEMDVTSFITNKGNDNLRVLNTEPLLSYIRVVLLDLLHRKEVPLTLRAGDWVYFRGPKCFLPHISRSEPLRVKKVLGNFRYKIEGQPLLDEIFLSFLRRADISSSQQTYSSNAFSTNQHESKTPENGENLDSIPLYLLICVAREIHMTSGPENATLETLSRQPNHGGSRLSKCFKIAQFNSRVLRSIGKLRLEIALSIEILYSSLREAISAINGEWYQLNNSPVFEDDLLNLMKLRNWCPARVVLPANIHLLYITSLLPSYETVPHYGCTTLACAQRTPGIQNLQAAHGDKCHGMCQLEVLDEAELISIIRCGGIPALSENPNCTGAASYHCINAAGKDFVAISHVWSHGLGNPTMNALPLCQIREIFKVIKALGVSNPILWIDTLSVPVNLEFKWLAIMKLREIYSTACKVLVIDRHLSYVGASRLEQRLQLQCSEWAHRLWTLQEGRLPLPENLYIQFRDRAISVTELLATDRETYDSSGASTFIAIYDYSTDSLRKLFLRNENFSSHFLDVARDLSRRGASVKSDERICLATLVGLQLEALPPNLTMMDIYRSVTHVPEDLIFLSPQNKLKEPGFRWAPASFLEMEVPSLVPPYVPGVLTASGLRICKDCIMLPDGIVIQHIPNHCPTEMFYITCSGSQDWWFLLPGEEYRVSVSLESAAIILQSVDPDISGTVAALVGNLAVNDNVHHCSFEMGLIMFQANPFKNEEGDKERATYRLNGLYKSRVIISVD